MSFMYATEKNYKICEKIITLFHENAVSVDQSCAILSYVKSKIARDTTVGELISFEKEQEMIRQQAEGAYAEPEKEDITESAAAEVTKKPAGNAGQLFRSGKITAYAITAAGSRTKPMPYGKSGRP